MCCFVDLVLSSCLFAGSCEWPYGEVGVGCACVTPKRATAYACMRLCENEGCTTSTTILSTIS